MRLVWDFDYKSTFSTTSTHSQLCNVYINKPLAYCSTTTTIMKERCDEMKRGKGEQASARATYMTCAHGWFV